MEPKIKILIADENREFRSQFISKLKGMGYHEISEAENGDKRKSGCNNIRFYFDFAKIRKHRFFTSRASTLAQQVCEVPQ